MTLTCRQPASGWLLANFNYHNFFDEALDIKTDEIMSLKKFFQVNLKKVIFSEPEKESDIQDAIEQLLIGRALLKGIDYDRERGRVKVSIKEFAPDFFCQG